MTTHQHPGTPARRHLARTALRATALLTLLGVAWAGRGSGAPSAPVASGETHLVINVPSRTLTLFVDGKARKTYPVGVGQPQWPTPIGRWQILEKVKNPTWGYPPEYDPHGKRPVFPAGSPRNPLGTRWMGFTPKEHGIHGTNRPDSVGKVISHGCVRMHVRDAEELFELVEVGTPVEVRHDTVLFRVDPARRVILAAVYPDVYRKRASVRAQVDAVLKRHGARPAAVGGNLNKQLARRDGKYRIVGKLPPAKPE
ncbi:MAG: L,D-transpeptidase [Armatimonadetes bacterium]|jgi:lipoprotein-anchoring transpeptidase ErfK/SrfK|nr:L,D-transpeptidase [Armatimonadota bacterium]